MTLNNIDHVVHLMFENRSFDNLLGYLYAPNDLPKYNIPPANPTTFNGLAFGGPWFNLDKDGKRFNAVTPTTAFGTHSPNVVPWPDPGEPFDDVHEQLFHAGGPKPTMSGFFVNYAHQKGVAPDNVGQIMQNYSKEQLPVLSTLARSFAVSDAWYCSMPTQTWPNRGFAHSGSSDGNVLNSPYIPWGIDTIFTTLQKLNISWGVYHDTLYTPALAQLQFRKHWSLAMDHGFGHFKDFLTRCNAHEDAPPSMKLPAYSFVEPRFAAERWLLTVHHSEDYHPPHNVQHGELFLAEVYNAIKSSPYRDRILLIITFDEHGGTYDHAAPPDGAKAPLPVPVAKNGFNYDLFGVRVPAIIVSTWVKPGTVFRSTASTPYDHTSILATLRDWKGIPQAQFLPSPRIEAAPTIDSVLSESANEDWPDVVPKWAAQAADAAAPVAEDMTEVLNEPPDAIEKSLLASTEYMIRYREAGAEMEVMLEDPAITAKVESMLTRLEAMEEMVRLMLGRL
jgi:phospholipase C